MSIIELSTGGIKMKLIGNFLLLVLKIFLLPLLLISFLSSFLLGAVSIIGKVALSLLNLFILIGTIGSIIQGDSELIYGLGLLFIIATSFLLFDSIPLFFARISGKLTGFLWYWF